mmetsp:Transcript_99474/g.176514  ORF Transcript_99474/g.176514 Transcript_99474/m.176514 type:complete len:301 (-) Transcript_99474:202-1104(-)
MATLSLVATLGWVFASCGAISAPNKFTHVVIGDHGQTSVTRKRQAFLELGQSLSASSMRQSVQILGNLSLLRRYTDTVGGCQRAPHQPYTVVYIFAGRKDRMQLLMKYLDTMLFKGLVHEVHIWGRAREHADARWIEGLKGNKAYQVRTGGLSFRPIYQYYATKGNFTPVCSNVTLDATVLVKIDDDIVYVDISKFQAFTRYVLTHPSMFLVHANIVNNGVSAYYQSLNVKELGEQIPATKKYPKNAAPLDGAEALKLHRFFLAHRDQFSWEDPASENCLVFRAPGTFFGELLRCPASIL